MPPSPLPRPHGAEPPVRDRGDACPGALRLHSAADGHLARVRLPAGCLTSRQAAALADAAERLGDGHLSLTSRGNTELRGLPDACGQELAAVLREAGLLPSARHERIRNILASPLAGLDQHTPSDVQLWARRLDALLCASASATALSGRFLFVLDDGRGDVAALGGDVTLVAEADGSGGGGALLRIGDDPAAVRIAGPDVPRTALIAAESFLTAAEASGTGAWRVRELPAGYALNARDVADGLRKAGVGVEYVAAAGAEPVPAAAPGGPLPGVVEGPGGRRALCVLAPLGRLTVAQWRLLTAVAAADGCGDLRVTPWRGVLVPGLTAATAGPRLHELAAAGLIIDPDSPWHRIGACTGRPGCVKSRSDVRADAAAALGRATAAESAEGARASAEGTHTPTEDAGMPVEGSGMPVEGARRLPVHWSGCERRCGHPQGRWIDVLATGEGYRVSAVGQEVRPDVRPDHLPPEDVPLPLVATAIAAATRAANADAPTAPPTTAAATTAATATNPVPTSRPTTPKAQ
ncbi:cobalamin biosynthesis protein CobG [Streptomyces halobius]|uniref:Cobalamin biosynthesis protein CobG n=2 Tax=Streptomyces halobius TaxID=2879846 RepID=A0ABY4M9H5_9ACTN|nr:cobalamin biosynthesis protein CobG [Streptomyces halobius]UQA94392.1 cobalamin biosynthesis protein CobG [Streptomyces halobius]